MKSVDQVNQSIIVLKAQMIHEGPSKESSVVAELGQEELKHAIDYMISFLERLALLEYADDHNAQLLPNEAVSQLSSTVIAETPDFFPQLRNIQLTLEKQHILNPVQLELLDQIVETLDQERSELFKKLRAARG